MNIRPGSLILEVGSGNSPRHQSSILCDRYIHDNSQRAGKFSIVINRPFVVANGYYLPFQDKAFDYVICSHVLEHLTDPQKFIKELERVAHAGYIEVPSIYGERLFGWDFHLWYCRLIGKKLVFYSKDEGERYGGFFHRLIAKSIVFRSFFEKYEKYFYVQYEWRKKIDFAIELINDSELKNIDKKNFELLKQMHWNFSEVVDFWVQWMKRRVQNKIVKTKRNIFWTIKKELIGSVIVYDLLQIMQCVYCHSRELIIQKKHIVCKNCNSTFPMYGVIPIMLTQEEQKEGY